MQLKFSQSEANPRKFCCTKISWHTVPKKIYLPNYDVINISIIYLWGHKSTLISLPAWFKTWQLFSSEFFWYYIVFHLSFFFWCVNCAIMFTIVVAVFCCNCAGLAVTHLWSLPCLCSTYPSFQVFSALNHLPPMHMSRINICGYEKTYRKLTASWFIVFFLVTYQSSSIVFKLKQTQEVVTNWQYSCGSAGTHYVL